MHILCTQVFCAEWHEIDGWQQARQSWLATLHVLLVMGVPFR